jgi:hypothetical protein
VVRKGGRDKRERDLHEHFAPKQQIPDDKVAIGSGEDEMTVVVDGDPHHIGVVGGLLLDDLLLIKGDNPSRTSVDAVLVQRRDCIGRRCGVEWASGARKVMSRRNVIVGGDLCVDEASEMVVRVFKGVDDVRLLEGLDALKGTHIPKFKHSILVG